jgi:hypothetical protein
MLPPAVTLPAVVALPRCCTAEAGVTVSTPTIPAIPNAAKIAIARTKHPQVSILKMVLYKGRRTLNPNNA